MTTTHVRTPSSTVPVEPFRDPEFVIIDRGGYPLVLHREELHAATRPDAPAPDVEDREALDQALTLVETWLGNAWDDGNARGLDGWVGPNRGAGVVDEQAVHDRRVIVDEALDAVAVPLRALATRQPAPVDGETTTEWGVRASGLLDGHLDDVETHESEADAREALDEMLAPDVSEHGAGYPDAHLVSREVTAWREVQDRG